MLRRWSRAPLVPSVDVPADDGGVRVSIRSYDMLTWHLPGTGKQTATVEVIVETTMMFHIIIRIAASSRHLEITLPMALDPRIATYGYVSVLIFHCPVLLTWLQLHPFP